MLSKTVAAVQKHFAIDHFIHRLEQWKHGQVKRFHLTISMMQSICFVALTVADTLLWKDKKQTFKALLVLITIYYNFIASQATVITVISKSLMFASIFVFISSNLPEKMYACPMPLLHMFLSVKLLFEVASHMN